MTSVCAAAGSASAVPAAVVEYVLIHAATAAEEAQVGVRGLAHQDATIELARECQGMLSWIANVSLLEESAIEDCACLQRLHP